MPLCVRSLSRSCNVLYLRLDLADSSLLPFAPSLNLELGDGHPPIRPSRGGGAKEGTQEQLLEMMALLKDAETAKRMVSEE